MAKLDMATTPAILVIEDNIPFQNFVVTFLEFEGYRVFKANDGEEGIAAFIERKPQLIITDIVMPKKEGLDLILSVRELDTNIPIIATSGGNHGFGDDYLRMANKLGANQIFHKPFQSKHLLTAISNLLNDD